MMKATLEERHAKLAISQQRMTPEPKLFRNLDRQMKQNSSNCSTVESSSGMNSLKDFSKDRITIDS